MLYTPPIVIIAAMNFRTKFRAMLIEAVGINCFVNCDPGLFACDSLELM